MRKYLLIAVTAAAFLAVGSAALAMGGYASSPAPSSGGYGNDGDYHGTNDDYSVALRLIEHQQYADAIPHLGMALADKPNNADILNYLGYTNRMVGQTLTGDAQAAKFKASLDYYRRALAIDPSHRGVHEYLGELYLQMHDPASATNEMNTLATLCPGGCVERDMLAKAMAAAATQ